MSHVSSHGDVADAAILFFNICQLEIVRTTSIINLNMLLRSFEYALFWSITLASGNLCMLLTVSHTPLDID